MVCRSLDVGSIRCVARWLANWSAALTLPAPKTALAKNPMQKCFSTLKRKNLVKIDCPPQKIGALLPSMKKNIGALPAFATAIIACVMLAISPVPLFFCPPRDTARQSGTRQQRPRQEKKPNPITRYRAS